MAYIQGTDRLQTTLFCLEDFIAPDAPVRVIDAFCAQVDYVTLDFRGKFSGNPFGTIKRAWGYSYTLVKGMKKVSADLGLVYLCYNLKRVMNSLTPEKMLQKLQLAA